MENLSARGLKALFALNKYICRTQIQGRSLIGGQLPQRGPISYRGLVLRAIPHRGPIHERVKCHYCVREAYVWRVQLYFCSSKAFFSIPLSMNGVFFASMSYALRIPMHFAVP